MPINRAFQRLKKPLKPFFLLIRKNDKIIIMLRG